MSHDRGCPCGREKWDYASCPEKDCYKREVPMLEPVVIGGTNLPTEVDQKFGEFIEWLDQNYEIENGSSALFWGIAHQLSAVVKEK